MLLNTLRGLHVTRFLPTVACALLLGNSIAAPIKADEAAEQMIDDALQHMYHTCESLVRIAGEDEDMMIDVLRKIASVSLYMRGINIADLDLSDEQTTTIRNDFLQSVSESCAEDRFSLLAGVVDNAVKDALDL